MRRGRSVWRLMIRRLCGLLIILAIADVLLPTKRAATQTVPASRFSLVFSPGLRPAGSWGRAIAAGMRRGNLDGDRCGDYSQIACQAPNYPDVDQDLLSYNIQLAFRASSILELTLAYGSVSAGRVWGYFDGGNTGTADSDAELLLMMHAKTVTLSGRYRVGEFVRIGGGPASALGITGQLRRPLALMPVGTNRTSYARRCPRHKRPLRISSSE